MVYFGPFDHTYACQQCQTTGMLNSLFDGLGFAEYQFDRSLSVSENAHKQMVYLDQILHTFTF